MNIIQIGCNSGNDNAFQIIKEVKSDVQNIILIDPLIECLFKAKETYSEFKDKITLLNCVISNENGITSFYHPLEDNQSVHSSLSLEHVGLHRHNKIRRIITPSIKINDLLNIINAPVAFLFVDAEGSDFEIVNAVDLKKYQIEVIVYENSHTDGVFQRTINNDYLKLKLMKYGYSVKEYGNDTIAIKNNSNFKLK